MLFKLLPNKNNPHVRSNASKSFDKDDPDNNLMDYAPGARHIAKWQWDLMHDPGVVARVFERDKDAIYKGGHISGQEYIVRDGEIVDLDNSHFYNLHKSKEAPIKKFLSTKITMLFLNKIAQSTVLKNFIYESGVAVELAATSVGFLVPEIRSNKMGLVFKDIDAMKNISEAIYKESKLCIRTYFTNQINDHALAHEFFIHNLRAFTQINEIDFNSLSKSKAIALLEKISSYSRYAPGDGGDREHYEFITGQKKEMTQYTLERLVQETTHVDKINYLRTYLSEIGKYIDTSGKYQNILNENGGYCSVISKIKTYLQEDFKEYENYIFEPVENLIENLKLDAGQLNNDLNNKNNKQKSLWNIYVEKNNCTYTAMYHKL